MVVFSHFRKASGWNAAKQTVAVLVDSKYKPTTIITEAFVDFQFRFFWDSILVRKGGVIGEARKEINTTFKMLLYNGFNI